MYAVVMFLLHLNVETTDRYDKEQSKSPLTSLEARWPAQQASQICGTSHLAFENASL